jgi:hypothetical protein
MILRRLDHLKGLKAGTNGERPIGFVKSDPRSRFYCRSFGVEAQTPPKDIHWRGGRRLGATLRR